VIRSLVRGAADTTTAFSAATVVAPGRDRGAEAENVGARVMLLMAAPSDSGAAFGLCDL